MFYLSSKAYVNILNDILVSLNTLLMKAQIRGDALRALHYCMTQTET